MRRSRRKRLKCLCQRTNEINRPWRFASYRHCVDVEDRMAQSTSNIYKFLTYMRLFHIR